jgi:hypothetical protein
MMESVCFSAHNRYNAYNLSIRLFFMHYRAEKSVICGAELFHSIQIQGEETIKATWHEACLMSGNSD